MKSKRSFMLLPITECISETTSVVSFIKKIETTEKTIVFYIGDRYIKSSPNHLFKVFNSSEWVLKEAKDLRVDDPILVPVTFLSKGDKVLGADGKAHSILKGD